MVDVTYSPVRMVIWVDNTESVCWEDSIRVSSSETRGMRILLATW